MLAESRRHPDLITQIVPSPITLPYDSTIQDIIGSGQLGEILHVEVGFGGPGRSGGVSARCCLPVLQVRAVTGKFAQKAGSEMTWRQDASLSGLNTMSMGGVTLSSRLVFGYGCRGSRPVMQGSTMRLCSGELYQRMGRGKRCWSDLRPQTLQVAW